MLQCNASEEIDMLLHTLQLPASAPCRKPCRQGRVSMPAPRTTTCSRRFPLPAPPPRARRSAASSSVSNLLEHGRSC